MRLLLKTQIHNIILIFSLFYISDAQADSLSKFWQNTTYSQDYYAQHFAVKFILKYFTNHIDNIRVLIDISGCYRLFESIPYILCVVFCKIIGIIHVIKK